MREVAVVAIVVAGVSVLALAWLEHSVRRGARGHEAVAALVGSAGLLVLLAWSAGATGLLLRPASRMLALAIATAVGVYAVTGLVPLANVLRIGAQNRAGQRSIGVMHLFPTTQAPAYWAFEITAMALAWALMAFGLSLWTSAGTAFPPGVLIACLVPLSVALPPLLRSTIGPRFQTQRMEAFAAVASSDSGMPPSWVQTWLSEISRNLGVGDLTLVLASSRRTFLVRAGRGSFVVFDRELFDIMDAQEQRAVIAHEIAHAERNETVRRALVVAGLTLWYVGLIGLSVIRGHLQSVTSVMLVAVVFAYALDFARGVLAHRAEFAADRRAAEIVGDPSVVVRALTRIAQVQRASMNRSTRSHPSYAKRIEALQAYATMMAPQ